MAFKLVLKREHSPEADEVIAANEGRTIMVKDIAVIVRKLTVGNAIERAYGFFLTGSGNLVGYIEAGIGGMNYVSTDPRALFTSALIAGAAEIILAHNHPDGTLSPSGADVKHAKRVAMGCQSVGLVLRDSLIIAGETYLSMGAAGLLPNQKEVINELDKAIKE